MNPIRLGCASASHAAQISGRKEGQFNPFPPNLPLRKSPATNESQATWLLSCLLVAGESMMCGGRNYWRAGVPDPGGPDLTWRCMQCKRLSRLKISRFVHWDNGVVSPPRGTLNLRLDYCWSWGYCRSELAAAPRKC